MLNMNSLIITNDYVQSCFRSDCALCSADVQPSEDPTTISPDVNQQTSKGKKK